MPAAGRAGRVHPSGGHLVTSSERPLRVLLLEDSAADAELVTQALTRAGLTAVIERVDSKDAFTCALRDFAPGVVLSDHSISQFDARAALEVLHAVRPATPLIVVSGTLDWETAVACLRAGAEDFVFKGDLSRLAPAVAAALAAREGLERLTPRQLEVLRLVAQGHTTREIARRLKLSAKTVESHRGEVMKRLGIHDVVGLVRYALRLGLVRPES